MPDLSDEFDAGQTVQIPRFSAGQLAFRRYALEEIIGRGGMGVVWRARDEQLERSVALKVIPESLSLDRAALNSLKRETKLGLSLAHPNIVRIYDFLQEGSLAAISMEYVDGGTLSDLRLNQPHEVFEARELASYVDVLCEALEYAHTREKIVHRDLKPRNLMLTSEGQLKIADFGISRNMSEGLTMLTGTLGSAGSPAYSSPQQWDGERPSALDDIYSVGATIYELLTGRPPFLGVVDWQQIHHKVPPSISQRRLDLGLEGVEPVPVAWEEAVAACLAKVPAQRPQSIRALRERLAFPVPPTFPPVVEIPPEPTLPEPAELPVAVATEEESVVSEIPEPPPVEALSEAPFEFGDTVAFQPAPPPVETTIEEMAETEFELPPPQAEVVPEPAFTVAEIGALAVAQEAPAEPPSDEAAPSETRIESLPDEAEVTAPNAFAEEEEAPAIVSKVTAEEPGWRPEAEPQPPLTPPEETRENSLAPSYDSIAEPETETLDPFETVLPVEPVALPKIPLATSVPRADLRPTSEPVRTRKSRVPLLVVLAATGVLGGFFYFLPGRSKTGGLPAADSPKPQKADVATPVPSPPPLPIAGNVEITTDPSGASIKFDDRPLAVSPSLFENVRGGQYQVSISMEGYEPRHESIEFDPHDPKPLRFSLSRTAMSLELEELSGDLRKQQVAPDSPAFLLAAAAYLQFAKKNGISAKDQPVGKVTGELRTGLEKLREKQEKMNPTPRQKDFERYRQSIRISASDLDLFPAILLLADHAPAEEAFNWYYYAANEKQSAYAMRKVGHFYYHGTVMQAGKPDFALAWQAFNRAADAGDKDAAVWRARCQLFEKGTKRDEVAAVATLKELAEKQVSEAEIWLGISYEKGWGGLEVQPSAALELYNSALRRENWFACVPLGKLYQRGYIGKDGREQPPDPRKAGKIYKQGADHEEPACMYLYGKMLVEDGGKTTAEKRDGVQWINKASLAGLKEATDWLDTHPKEAGTARLPGG